MSDKTPGKSGKTQNRRNDDFRLIKGITRNFKSKLYEHGVMTFDQLANLSPSEILAMIGSESELTVNRIKRDDWIGQARRLADEAEELRAESTPADNDLQETYASYALELKLDQDNRVKQTRILYVGGTGKDAEEKWPGWDGNRMLGFIEKCGKLKPAVGEQSTVNESSSTVTDEIQPENSPSIELERPTAEIARPGKSSVSRSIPEAREPISLCKFEVISSLRNQPACSFRINEPYRVSLLIDTSELGPYAGQGMAFEAIVKAKNLRNSEYSDVGASRGHIEAREDASFEIECRELTPGDYRLSAMVTLNIPHNGSSYDIKSVLDGSVIHVW